ncbi:hypothetical protein [Herbaspirillum seropedicae]|uniref:hypothetical protein n=1 Tax=Herbaspirillum seropedicae TaxID=964 RepID=UPI003FCE4CE9
MTVSAANPPFNEYTAAPGASVFPYTFKVIKSDDMKVLVNGVGKQIGVDYTLSGVGENNGGNVTFLAPMTGGENVVTRMDLVFDRQTDYQQNGDYLSPTVNNDYDRIWLAIQQIGQSLKAAIKLPFTTTAEQSINQSASERANTVLAFDASGNLTVSVTDAQNVALAQAAAAAAAASAASINPADLVHRSGTETITGAKTFSVRPVVGTAGAATNDDAAASTAFVNRAIVSAQGLFRTLAGNASGLNSLVSYTIGELITGDNTGSYQSTRGWSGSIDMTVLGVGGIDVGTVAANTFYYTYGITKLDGTKGYIASLSPLAPSFANAPGYIKWSRIGSFRTDNTANKYPMSFIQSGRRMRYKPAVGSNVTGLPTMSSGIVATPGSTTSAVSVSNFVPPTAGVITVLLTAQGNNATMLAFPSSATVGYADAQLCTTASSGGIGNVMGDIVLESSNIYYAANAAACLLKCVGWEDNL